jgi:excisionase family DNA binding protein
MARKTAAATILTIARPPRPPLPPHLEANRLITAETVAQLLGVSYRTLMRWVHEHKVPQPIRAFSKRRLLRKIQTILQFIDKTEANAVSGGHG